MEIEKLRYDLDYKGSLTASVDWIAGGNFDGYIYRVHLRFVKEGDKVIRKIKIVDDSRYDDEVYTVENYGIFSETDKGTIICVFPNFKMRGKFWAKQVNILHFLSFLMEIVNMLQNVMKYDLIDEQEVYPYETAHNIALAL